MNSMSTEAELKLGPVVGDVEGALTDALNATLPSLLEGPDPDASASIRSIAVHLLRHSMQSTGGAAQLDARCSPPEERREERREARGEWVATDWLSSLSSVPACLAAVLIAPSAPNHLDALRQLGRQVDDEAELAAHLLAGGVLEGLAAALLPALRQLAHSEANSSAELSSKFAGRVELSYGGLDAFFGGLEGQIGDPNPQVLAAMEDEHCRQPDSQITFVTGNYGVQTTSQTEWEFVNHPLDAESVKAWQARAWPEESTERLPDRKHCRSFKTIAELAGPLELSNSALRVAKQPEVTTVELVGARLYTGPLFEKYNAVLRGLNSTVPLLRSQLVQRCAPPQVHEAYVAALPVAGAKMPDVSDSVGAAFTQHARKASLEAATLRGALKSAGLPLGELEAHDLLRRYDSDGSGTLEVHEFSRLVQAEHAWLKARAVINRYCTTLHAINSAIIKLGKLTVATKVYRGVGGMNLPKAFWEPNEYGVKGGVENAFMSTTLRKEVAVSYASGSGMGIVFEITQGMVDRGACLNWLSQYPFEEEILFGPLTGIEVQRTRVEGSVVIIEARLSVNLRALTIEQVISKRRKLMCEMSYNMEADFGTIYQQEAWISLKRASPLDEDALEGLATSTLKSILRAICERDATEFNDDEQLGIAINEALDGRRAIEQWPSGLDRVAEIAGVDASKLSECEVLSLSGCNPLGPLGDSGAGGLAVMMTDTADGSFHALRSLCLDDNQLSDLGVHFLAQGLSRCGARKLHYLHLAGNNISAVGIGFIGRCPLPQLLLLGLARNRLGDEGVKVLATLFTQSTWASPRVLELRCNGIGDLGLAALAECPELRTELLDLSANELSAAGVERFASQLTGGALSELKALQLDAKDDGGVQALTRVILEGALPRLAEVRIHESCSNTAARASLVVACNDESRATKLRTSADYLMGATIRPTSRYKELIIFTRRPTHTFCSVNYPHGTCAKSPCPLQTGWFRYIYSEADGGAMDPNYPGGLDAMCRVHTDQDTNHIYLFQERQVMQWDFTPDKPIWVRPIEAEFPGLPAPFTTGVDAVVVRPDNRWHLLFFKMAFWCCYDRKLRRVVEGNVHTLTSKWFGALPPPFQDGCDAVFHVPPENGLQLMFVCGLQRVLFDFGDKALMGDPEPLFSAPLHVVPQG